MMLQYCILCGDHCPTCFFLCSPPLLAMLTRRMAWPCQGMQTASQAVAQAQRNNEHHEMS